MKVFQLTFEQSKKVVFDRTEIINSTESQVNGSYFHRKYNIFHRFLGFIGLLFFIIMAYAVGVGTRGMANDDIQYVSQSVGKEVAKVSVSVTYLIYGVLGLLVAVLLIYLLIPPFNFMYLSVITFIILFLWWLSAYISIFPLAFGAIVGGWGKIAGYLMLIYIVYFVCYFIKSTLFDALSEAGVKDYEPREDIFMIITAIIVGSSLIFGIIHCIRIGSFWDFAAGLFFPIAYLLLTWLIALLFLTGLTYYYFAKYPKEYREAYNISDAVWYLSKRRAKRKQKD